MARRQGIRFLSKKKEWLLRASAPRTSPLLCSLSIGIQFPYQAICIGTHIP